MQKKCEEKVFAVEKIYINKFFVVKSRVNNKSRCIEIKAIGGVQAQKLFFLHFDVFV